MRKYRASFSVVIIAMLFIISMVLILFNDGRLILKNFPLRQRWSVNLGEQVQGISTNRDNIIFARTSRKLTAIEVDTGKILWEHKLAIQASSEPAIENNGIVYIADAKSIWAVDQVDGAVIWKAPVPMSVAKVRGASQNVVAVEGGSYIYVYKATDGSLLWSKPVCRYGGVLAYVDYSQVYVPCIGRIRAMNGSSGEIEWETEASFSVAKVAYQDGVMYYSPVRTAVSAYNLRNRSEIWVTPFQGKGYRLFKILRDNVYITGSDKICALQMATGDQLWCIDFKTPQNPTSIGNQLFVFNGYQNNISAYNIASGQKIGDLTVRNMKFYIIQGELMLSLDNTLIFGSDHRVFGYGQ